MSDTNKQAVAGSVTTVLGQPTYFLQWDARWKNKMFSIVNNVSQTIGTSGCGPTSASMVINTFVDKSYSPIECADWVIKAGYRTVNSGCSYGMFKALAVKFGFAFLQTASFNEAKAFLDKNSGSVCVCSMTKGIWTKSGHYILMYKTDGVNVCINDPNSTNANRVYNSVANLKSQCLQYFCFALDSNNPLSWADRSTVDTINKTFIVNCADIVYLCSKPSTSTKSDQFFKSGEILKATNKCGDWYLCYHEAQFGWIPASYLDEANLENMNSASAVECLDAFKKLKDEGFIDSYDWWMTHVFDIDYTSNLIINIANCEDHLGNTDSGKFKATDDESVKEAINYIYRHGGIISTPKYWIDNLSKLGDVKYILVKCANRL